MNWHSYKTFGWVVSAWLAISVSANGQVHRPAAPTAQGSPPEIKLNGLTTILGDKRALFKLRFDSGTVESYCLAEGQSAGGITLQSVDIHTGKIKVINHGMVQTIALCDPPDLSTFGTTVENAGNGANRIQARQNFAGGFGVSGVATTGVSAGQNSGAGFLAGNATAGSANSSPGAASSNNPGPADAAPQNSRSATSNSGNTSQLPEPFSTRSAREFERLRIQTAAGVYNGTDEPLPLTPLTPPGTPMALIGPDKAWFPD